MRQVPRYAIIGSGRLARHFCHYFHLLGISFQQWSRRDDPTLEKLPSVIEGCDRVLVLISDSAIESFIQDNLCLKEKVLIHCSGQLVTSLAHSAHPPYPFTQKLYSLDRYLKIPFVIEKEGPEFADLLPELSNPHVKIDKKLKPFYHALCVMGGNFTTLLWQKVSQEFERKLNFPKGIAHPYLEQIFLNLLQEPEDALAGPLVRGDTNTIVSNLNALAQDPYQEVYQAFVNAYQNSGDKK